MINGIIAKFGSKRSNLQHSIVSRKDDRSNNSRREGVWGTWGSGQLGGGRDDLALPGKGDRGGQVRTQ